MRIITVVLVGALAATTACRKGTGGTGGGGGGGGWLVGSSGLMVNIDPNGRPSGYDLGSEETLNGIACRYLGEAWVVGEHGTVLYTDDGGESWLAQVVPSTANLRALATQDAGPVFLAGDGAFLMSTDTGASWASLGDGTANFRSVAAAQAGSTVLALADDGRVFAVANGALAARTTIPGARVLAVSPDGQMAIAAGAGLSRSSDGGATWTALAADPAMRFDDVRIDDTGEATAVGAKGVVAHVMTDGAILADHIGTADLHSLHVGGWGPADTGYAAGDGGQVWITHDSGWSWEQGPNVGGTVLGIDQIGLNHR